MRRMRDFGSDTRMGIYDRDYYREDTPRWGGTLGHPGTVGLITYNVALFFVQVFTTHPGRTSALLEWGEFHFDKVIAGEVWRIFTGGLIPDGALFGVILSGVMLFWAGKEVERTYGTRPFVAFYILAAFAATLAKFAVGFAGIDQAIPSVGTGGSLFAVLVLYACLDPKRPTFIFGIPIALVVSILLGLAVLSTLREGGTKVHAVGYIAGAVFGFLFFKTAPVVLNWLHTDRRRPAARSPVRLHVSPVAEEDERPSSADENSRPTPPAMPRAAAAVDEQLEAKLDQVLSKVAKQGRASLTKEENEILQKASEIYKKKRS